MSEQRFPFRRLPDDICLKVLKTTDYCEMAGYSLVSKKAHSMVKSLRVPITRGKILVASSMEIRLITNDLREIDFNFKVPENDGEMTSLNDLPVRVDVSMKKNLTDWRGDKVNWSNQGMSFEQWIQHISSIFHNEGPIPSCFILIMQD
ncbi:hypothetical protein B9Z55_011063 [Caenorhabditis nigoni]|uniref:F-box domain-containing protein n=1 Tax=Caenorhabditis nigoni TaxID=1611254 RepID=A0A2G5UIH6_9PELO|nr:hypothetical protein B9Z55_011063 [Caenorhabditis nigoni]